MHGRIDFTGGYDDDAHCEWAVRCAAGAQPAVLLRFTALDTEHRYDFVSLYDGDSAEALRLAVRAAMPAPGAARGAWEGQNFAIEEAG